jgi:cystathionine gamma-lyase
MLVSLESSAAHALTFASGTASIDTAIRSLGHNAHVVSVNDIYGGTFCYMTQVERENQGLKVTFLDLENADEEQVSVALRDNTKVCLFRRVTVFLWIPLSDPLAPTAHMDRVSH